MSCGAFIGFFKIELILWEWLIVDISDFAKKGGFDPKWNINKSDNRAKNNTIANLKLRKKRRIRFLKPLHMTPIISKLTEWLLVLYV
jgi:hypothetical protein